MKTVNPKKAVETCSVSKESEQTPDEDGISKNVGTRRVGNVKFNEYPVE